MRLRVSGAVLLLAGAVAGCAGGSPEARSTWTSAAKPRVVAYAGEKHCGWESVTILRLDDDRQFVRDPKGVVGREWLAGAYEPHAVLPADAKDTGYQHGRQKLWLSADASAAFVVDGSDVERWPGVRKGWGCD